MNDLQLKIRLSGHQHSIMSDELTTTLLAYIEISGTTNEYELASTTGVPIEDLNKVLLKLYKNNYIKYGKKYLIISENGKDIIERLGFVNDIIEVNLEEFDFEEKEKKDLVSFLKSTRNISYSEYLKTLTDLRIWNNLSKTNNEKTKNISQERKVGALCHINKLFLTVSMNESNKFNHFDLEIPSKIFVSSLHEVLNFERSKKFILNDYKSYVIDWLKNIYEIDSKRKFYSETKEKSLRNIFISYSLPRYRIHNEDWCSIYFNDLNHHFHWHNVLRFNRVFNGKEFNHKALLSNFSNIKLNFSANYFKSLNDTHELLSISNDIKELSEFVGVSEVEVSGYLETIKRNIDKLNSASNKP